MKHTNLQKHLTPKNKNKPQDICYVVFTSGSTGEPKGIQICHQNVVNYCNNNNNNNAAFYHLLQRGRSSIVSVTNIVFDIFVTETIFPLLNGILIYLANEEECISQKKLSQLIEKHHIEVIQTTPTKMRSFLTDKKDLQYLKTLKEIILGGEALAEELVSELQANTDATITNIYGPAETTVWSSNKEIGRQENERSK